MPFYRKFQRLYSLKAEDVEKPKSLWLTYAVCACSAEACEWEGWLIDGVFNHGSAKHRMDLPKGGVLPASDRQRCPRCGRALFRTEVSYKFLLSKDQTPASVAGVDYKVGRMVYDGDRPNMAASQVQPNAPGGRVPPSIRKPKRLKRSATKTKTPPEQWAAL